MPAPNEVSFRRVKRGQRSVRVCTEDPFEVFVYFSNVGETYKPQGYERCSVPLFPKKWFHFNLDMCFYVFNFQPWNHVMPEMLRTRKKMKPRAFGRHIAVTASFRPFTSKSIRTRYIGFSVQISDFSFGAKDHGKKENHNA